MTLDISPEILHVSPAEEDFRALCQVISRANWRLHWVPSWRLARRFLILEKYPIGVVISETELPDGNWKDLLAALDGLSCPPHLIISSRLADERLWAEVLNLGGYDVLLTPFEPEETLRVCSAAWLAWRGQLESPGRDVRKPLVAGGTDQPNHQWLAVAAR